MAGKFFLYVNQSLDATSAKISSFSRERSREETCTHSRQFPGHMLQRQQITTTAKQSFLQAEHVEHSRLRQGWYL